MKIYMHLIFMFLWSIAAHGQLIEQVGGVKTDFVISNEENILNVSTQAILKRGLTEQGLDWDAFVDGAYGYAYGLGVEVFRLEFMTDSNLKEAKGKKNAVRKYELRFYTKTNELLLMLSMPDRYILNYSNLKSNFVYSINLQYVPFIVLEETHRIDIQQVIVP
ncbi:MAG: hypothetical protein AAF806_22495 [Bacteroidota bacterium]